MAERRVKAARNWAGQDPVLRARAEAATRLLEALIGPVEMADPEEVIDLANRA